ncbi:plasmid partitioning protein RepB C-terminal domain-containing protein [Aestuariivirga sp.]|uniref:plasmid partitioning protein RepB C-terminal domain-containing protein n=1 Tax=Aestuariivirga sp. TaxID=2650926 RepID=UPI0039E32BBD
MSVPSRTQRVEIIPLAKINVLNPRARNKRHHREIVENIDAIGLKRPITVSQRVLDGDVRYDLICGEGRLQAFKMLGQSEIPAVIVDAPENDCLVMSLVENIARRQHRPIDIMQEIGSLHSRGYTDIQIAEKVGCTASWVNMIVSLLSRGEERLLTAVETGLMPLSLAVAISRAETDEAQNILMDAYTAGKLKGKKLSAIRKLLDQRLTRNKAIRTSAIGRKAPSRKITANDLMRVYEREAEKQRLLAKKSDFAQAKLLFIVEALKDLFSNDNFRTLLRAEKLEAMPQALAARVVGETA